MSIVIAVTNQKGGVGKTTTALNLGAGLKMAGKKVLFVDLDPQCSLTYGIGGNQSALGSYNVLIKEKPARAVIQETKDGDLISASPMLGGMDQVLVQMGKEQRLAEVLSSIKGDYDYIILDSPPTLGILTTNILTASDYVVIPAMADIFSLQGIGQLYSTIQAVKTYCNPKLKVLGILLCRYAERFILNREIKDLMKETASQLETIVFNSTIRESVIVRESQVNQKSIFQYNKKSNPGVDYGNFVNEVINILEK